ncbi:MAG: phosphatidylglycerophosphatase A [Candidatus Omnitrophica bacterium]|nr:phosphatidylglycerophosphatase A [Candidatus Omnitrophota bacterium]
MKRIAKIAATFFGLGYLPFMPGTWGAIAGVAIFSLLNGGWSFVILTIFITIIGFFVSDLVAKEKNEGDPSIIVIDEVSGQMIAYIGLSFSWQIALLGFVFFRAFDILKPLGIRSMEKIKGGYGIMLDDIVSGIYANIVVRIIVFMFNII